MDAWGADDERPVRRPRFAEEPLHQHQQQPGRPYAAPARPLVTPQQQHQHNPHQQAWLDPPSHTADARPGPTPEDGPAAAAPPPPAAVSADTTSRWLSCSFRSGVLGVAAYDRLTNELSVLQTADEGKGPGAFQMLQYIKLQVDPQVIILSATAEPALIEAAKLVAATAAGAAAAGDGDSTGEPLVQLQRPSLFTYNKALQMVNAIQVRSHQHQPPQQQQQPVYGRRSNRGPAGPAADLVDTSAQQQVAALGALVALLLQLQEEAPGEGLGGLVVDNISELKLDGHLIVDGSSLAALDIFKEEEHPSAMGIGSSKEGVSVYSLLQRCVTGMGRRLLRQWFLRPVVQLDVISSRHDTIELLVAAPTTNDALRAAMKKLQDLPRLVARLRLSQARPQLQAFKQLHDSIKQLMALKAAVAALAPRADTEAAAGVAAPAAAAAGGGRDDWQGPGSAAGAEFEELRQGQQPGWLFDDADAAEAAASGFFHQDHTDAFGSPHQPPSRRPGDMFRTPLVPPSSRARHPSGTFRGPADGPGTFGGGPPSRPGAWGGSMPAAGPWDALHITQRLLRCMGSELSACCCMIADVLDLSCSLEGCLVQPGVCAPLDELRGTVDQLPDILTEYVERELARVPPQVARRHSKQLWSLVYIPQVGFMVCVSGGKLGEEVLELLPDYRLAFLGEDGPAGTAAEEGGVELDRGCAYYTAECVLQLNAQYGDLQHRIADLEASICTELIKRLLSYGPALTAASAAVAELDCLCGLAAAARELGYCRPQLVADSIVHIEGGRHPLCELLAPGRFIDNNTLLGQTSTPPAAPARSQEDIQAAGAGRAEGAAGAGGSAAAGGPRMLLITGPNASGKSVYMKQVALIVYMAHVGSFVPARSATIGLTDRILTRLPGMESVVQHTSSFMSDLAQVSNLLARATSRSLVLLDEFGKGTRSADGVGLLGALLQHYAAQPSPPLLLACTHFSELLDPDVCILPREPQLSLCTMQVLVGGGSSSSGAAGLDPAAAAGGSAAGGQHMQQAQEGQGGAWEAGQEHVFLYKLVPGVVASSYGLHCARLCGVDPAVLTRAAEVLALQEAGLPINRLQAGELEQRDRMCWQLVHQLAALDTSNEAAVKQLMAAVVKEQAGCVGE